MEGSLKQEVLTNFVDVDFAGNVGTRKSITDFVFTLFRVSISGRSNI